jgi:WXXGXW repeat (2 copies)
MLLVWRKGTIMRKLFSIRAFLIASALLVLSSVAGAQVRVGVVVNFAPPEIPVYDQPVCPGDGYIWTPGYWAWDGDDYYWVPGTWVMPPEVGFLWTPGYWGWGGQGFAFYEGYWGPVVGFYGGINYGFGYFGHGYEGGRWDHDHFYYNRSVNNINVTEIHNVYNTTIVNRNGTRVSYNGGNGGITARPTAQEEAAAHERHVAATAAQSQQIAQARADKQLRASVNHGKPPVAATPKAGAFEDHGTAPAREGGRYMPPAENHESQPAASSSPRPTTIVHPSDIPKAEARPAPNTGDPKLDKKYQQQQEKLDKQQEQARTKLQKTQDSEHQKLEKQQANEAKKQQTEQKHSQQTQKLMQKQTQEQQHLQSHQAPPPHPAPSAPARPPHGE